MIFFFPSRLSSFCPLTATAALSCFLHLSTLRTPWVLPWKKLRHKIRFYFPSFFRFLLFSRTDSLLTDSLTLRWRQKQSDVWHYLLWDQFSVGLYLIIVWFRNVSSLISYTQIRTRCHWLRTTFTVMLMVSDVRVLKDPGVAVIEFCICS